MLHGIYSPHAQTGTCIKELEILWKETSNFIYMFCYDNPINQKVLHPAIPYLIDGITTKFHGCSYIIHVRISYFPFFLS